MSSDIGLIGLAVMGQNLVLNLDEKGFRVSVYNRTTQKMEQFLKERAQNTLITGYRSLQEFVASLQRPRNIILMVQAGSPVDELIEQLLPLLDKEDTIIDGGNSYFKDTERRSNYLLSKGIFFLGAGISGGEEGARHGPSIMPGGVQLAWPRLKPIFQAISAKVDGNEPCCEWVGPGGAGHFVKMVHNGIEYGDMELIAEIYDIAKRGLEKTNEEIADLFSSWNEGVLKSFLVEITATVLRKKEKGTSLVDLILDVAHQKGTGTWTATSALEMGIPLSLITESVFQRSLSGLSSIRQDAFQLFGSEIVSMKLSHEMLESALYAAKIMSYVQGFLLLQKASHVYGWDLNLGSCAMLWRGGCIIRSSFLGKIKEAYDRKADLDLLAFDPYFQEELRLHVPALRAVVSSAVATGIPVPSLSSAVLFFDSIRSQRLPMNLIQAERDFFGAHTFERIDAPRGAFFHEPNWQ